ncbi:QacE family quaternary ammonium compound efflux SMR transporter [Psychromonas sp. B3M02]|uniref:DMT family transporter n=1 Tax=unclassified Psychromonas TaxID=2614957 RepID=UPI000DEA9244|nr:multidrug efflux SMR transporter [Psychromonas sp. B3M02]RBW46097.1 QacE family quaternary ammonium compound efflux SMR transporter [Psychromonas sp. B3M02]
MGYWYLAIAIISEVIGTLALKASDGFSHWVYSSVCVIAYVITFYFLSLVLKTVPIGIAYAIWAGMGIVLVAAFGALVYKQVPDLAAIIGIIFIIIGVIILNVFSNTSGH